MPLILDTSILIDYLRGYAPALQYLDRLEREKIGISIITAMEVLQGTLTKKSFFIAQKFLSHFQILHISVEVSKKAFEFQKKYHMPHRLTLPDSFIAATAFQHKAVLITRNVRDFEYIFRLNIKRPYV